MPIANYTTSIPTIKTVAEIQRILIEHGAESILMNYGKDKSIESLSFMVETPFGKMSIRLPVNAQAVLHVLKKQNVPPRYVTYDQAVRVAWRIVKDWIRAQMAILETEMVSMEQIFLPYMVLRQNRTLYEEMIDRGFYLPEGRGE